MHGETRSYFRTKQKRSDFISIGMPSSLLKEIEIGCKLRFLLCSPSVTPNNEVLNGKTLEPSLDVPSGKITLKPLERESVILPSCPLTFTKSSLLQKLFYQVNKVDL